MLKRVYLYFAVENALLKLINCKVSSENLLPGVEKRTFEPKNLSDYPYFAVENAPLKLNIGFQVRTCFQEWKNAPFKIEHRVSSENLLPGVV